jgi:phosphoglycerate dehydrogenase-like enzyme
MAKTAKNFKILSTAPPLVLQLIENSPEKLPSNAVLMDGAELNKKDLEKELSEADCLLAHYSDPLTKETMEKGKKLKLIQTPSVGFQHIDIDAATRLEIPVANAAGFNCISVAEHAIMLILASIRKLPNVHNILAGGNWRLPDQSEMPYELMGKTVGIVGMGRIGAEVAQRLHAFGVDILYYDVFKPSASREKQLKITYATLNRLLKVSDVVTIHVPLMKKTNKLISTPQLNIMKSTAVLVNTSRGEVIDEPALVKALKAKKIRGAGLDVFCNEPVADRKLTKKWTDNPLLKLENIVLTPHTASWTTEAIVTRLAAAVIDNLTRVATRRTPLNIQNGVKFKR